MKLIITLLFTIFISIPIVYGQENEEPHNCRITGIISADMPRGLIQDYYVDYPYSLERLSESANIDGWGIASYQSFGDTAIIDRGAIRAINDIQYDVIIAGLERTAPNIILGHVRNCSAGCCAHGSDSIPDPHPFIREKDNRTWTFIHNGTASKPLLYELVGQHYLIENPLTGSGIAECDPADSDLVIDSELYFLLLLKNIEEHDWNVVEGIIEALRQINVRSYDEALNFILSDGNTIWSYRLDRTLYYYTDPSYSFTAIASRFPTQQQEDWITVHDHELLEVNAGVEPVIYDLCDYLPYVSGTITGPLGETVSTTYINTTNAPFSTRSDANSEYQIGCLSSGSYNIRYRHYYYADTIIQNVEVQLDDIEVMQNVILRYPGKLAGAVVDDNMMPLEDIRVSVGGTSHRAFTDEEGNFHMDSLDLGDFEISFIDEYYNDTTLADIHIASDSTTQLFMVMHYPTFITGVLTDSSGAFLENIVVDLSNPSRTDTSDFYGEFSFDSLDAGNYELSFYHINYADTIISEIEALAGDTAQVDIELRFLGYPFLLGDANMYYGAWPPRRIGNDVTYIVNYLSVIEACKPCSINGAWGSGDVTGDCRVLGSDVSRLVSYFRGFIGLDYCPMIPPQWSNGNEVPDEMPEGWPPCENIPDHPVFNKVFR